MSDSDTSYRVFIIRQWQDGAALAGKPTPDAARFVLEIPRTGERYGFTSSDALLSALNHQLDAPEITSRK